MDGNWSTTTRKAAGFCLGICLVSSATLPAEAFAQGFVRIQNRWKSTEYVNMQAGLASGPVKPSWWSADWIFERASADAIRIKNRWRKTYLHTQGGRLAAGAIQPTWNSALWRIEPVRGTSYFRIQNVSTGGYLHNQQGRIEVGPAPPNWWSAMWVLHGYKHQAVAASAAAIKWQPVGGSLKQVSGGNKDVWGVNASRQIWRRPVDGSGRWQKVCCSLDNVSASGKGWVWGVQASGQTFKCRKPCAADGSGWIPMDGRFKQVSADETHVWAVNASGGIFRRPVDGSGSWGQVAGSLKHVSASDRGWIWGVNGANQIYKCKKPCAANGSGWQQVPGSLAQVDANVLYALGVAPDGTLYRMPVDGSKSSWERVAGTNFQHVSASGDRWLWGVNRSNQIFKSEGVSLVAMGAKGGTDLAALGATAGKLGLGQAKGKALGSASEAVLDEGISKASKDKLKKSPKSTLKNMCAILSSASSAAAGQVDKKKQREAQERVLDQWVSIMYDAQIQSGVSLQQIDTQDLVATMAQIASDIDQETLDAVVDQGDIVPTGYRVTDPGGRLRRGATSIPVSGPRRVMIKGKAIVFKGVPGSYTLAQGHNGSGPLKITPLAVRPPHDTEVSTKPEWTSFDIARTALEVAGVADPTGVVAVAAAYLHPVCNTKEANSSRGDFCYKESQGRGVGIIPVTCNPRVSEKQAGLCYKPCQPGYHGVGPVCWTNDSLSIPRGVGVVPTGCPPSHPSFEGGLCYKSCGRGAKGVATICYDNCPPGYRDDGLYCGKQTYSRGAGYPLWDENKCNQKHRDVGGCEKKGLLWYPKCKTGFSMTTVNFCQTKGCPRGWQDIGASCKKPSRGRGVGVPRNACGGNVPDFDAGLCYKNCPNGYNGVGPVCWTEKQVSFGRGVGLVPDQCSSSHPNLDAGLCYKNCQNPNFRGVGPVCWGTCGGRYPVECASGCATSKLACGMVTTEMVVAPFEALASILSLGGYSVADKAKDSAKTAFNKAVREATPAAADSLGKRIGKKAILAAKAGVDKLDDLAKKLAKRKKKIIETLKSKVLDPVAAKGEAAKWQLTKAQAAARAKKLELKFRPVKNPTKATDDEKKILKEMALNQIEAERVAKQAAKAAKANSPKMLRRAEIKDRILKKLSQSWNNTDKAWLNVGRKCTQLGLNVAADWGGL